jgi:hypothetical protein
MLNMMSRKQVILLTSTILMVALITNIAGWLHNAEADPAIIITWNVTHACVDTDHNYQSDVCQTVDYIDIWSLDPIPHPDDHGTFEDDRDTYKSTSVTSCS